MEGEHGKLIQGFLCRIMQWRVSIVSPNIINANTTRVLIDELNLKKAF
jgi:hypothetical protein